MKILYHFKQKADTAKNYLLPQETNPQAKPQDGLTPALHGNKKGRTNFLELPVL
jgi:hypothetical protein